MNKNFERQAGDTLSGGDVTLKPKCYVYKCIACGGLDMAARSDKATCSPACRVKAHRSGVIKQLRKDITKFSGGYKTTPGDIARMNALDELCPELIPRILDGTLSMNDHEARWAVHVAFLRELAAMTRSLRSGNVE